MDVEEHCCVKEARITTIYAHNLERTEMTEDEGEGGGGIMGYIEREYTVYLGWKTRRSEEGETTSAVRPL